MKIFCCALLSILFSLNSFAQNNIQIDLADWKGKNESVPFNIVEVTDSRSDGQNIGQVPIRKKKLKGVDFASNSPAMIQKFVTKNFTQGNELEIILEIDRIYIENKTSEKKKKKTTTTFYYACKFYKKNSTSAEPLYTFTARNSIAKKSALKMSITNYIGRALSTSILNFKKSYLKHPEWKGKITSTPNTLLSKNIRTNQFTNGDTIALQKGYKLQDADFASSVQEDEKDNAYSYFMITYQLEDKDENNKINIDIYPKAYFLRSKSWAKKSDSTSWKYHQQLLFDLATHHATLFNKSLQKTTFSPGYYKSEINKIYNKMSEKYFDEMDALQAKTQYGANAQQEIFWREKVNNYMKND